MSRRRSEGSDGQRRGTSRMSAATLPPGPGSGRCQGRPARWSATRGSSRARHSAPQARTSDSRVAPPSVAASVGGDLRPAGWRFPGAGFDCAGDQQTWPVPVFEKADVPAVCLMSVGATEARCYGAFASACVYQLGASVQPRRSACSRIVMRSAGAAPSASFWTIRLISSQRKNGGWVSRSRWPTTSRSAMAPGLCARWSTRAAGASAG